MRKGILSLTNKMYSAAFIPIPSNGYGLSFERASADAAVEDALYQFERE